VASSSVSARSSTAEALKDVIQRVEAAHLQRDNATSVRQGFPRVVAVSKTKPTSAIIDCYAGGQRHFGENYAKELFSKSTDPDVLSLCPDIRWHFIGPATTTSNVKLVLKSPNLFMVETVQSIKIVDLMNGILKKSKRRDKLNIMVQINTSHEAQKGGVMPGEDAVSLTRHIVEKGSNMNLKGFMTIGSFDHDLSTGPNPDFVKLIETRDLICSQLNLQPDDYELSMGMSGDFEHAIHLGSTNVRIGTTIFGTREAKN